MVFRGTIVIAPAMGAELKIEILPACHHKLVGYELEKYYKELGAEAAKALYSGTPGGFWGAIEDFAVKNATTKGLVQRTRQW